MNIAVMSDIHGFSLALDRVIADISIVPGIERIIVAGDLCETGPDPKGVLDRLEAIGAECIQGNTDRDLAADSRSSASFRYTLDQIGAKGFDYLADLPFEIRIPPPGGTAPDDDLLVVHANPFDQDRKIAPDATDVEVRELIGDTRAAVIAFGHIHIAYIRRVAPWLLVDVSAVGNPKDGDLRSKWGLFSWDKSAHEWHAELRHVAYPLEETIAQVQASDVPNPVKLIERLKRASY
ncbi:MAG: metallophosphoesterase family protein [Thermomicrobiales bacterium]